MPDIELDIALTSSSKSNFDKEIMGLLGKYTKKPVEINVQIKEGSIESAKAQIKSLQDEIKKINLKPSIDLSNLIKTVNEANDKTSRSGKKDTNTSKKIVQQKELLRLAKEYSTAQKNFAKIGGEKYADKSLPNFEVYKKQLVEAKNAYNSFKSSLEAPVVGGAKKFLDKIFSDTQRAVERTEANFGTRQTVTENKDKQTNDYNELIRLQKEYARVQVEYEKAGGDGAGNAAENIKTKLEEARQAYEAFYSETKDSLSTKQLTTLDTNAKKTASALEKIRQKMSPLKQGTTEYQDALTKLNQEIATTTKHINQWTASKHGKSADSYRGLQNSLTSLIKLQGQLENGEISKDTFDSKFKEIRSDIVEYNKEIQNAGEGTQTFSTKVAGLASKFAQWVSVTQVVMFLGRSIKQMVTNVKELDTAMTELKKVTDETDSTYTRFLEGANTRAKRMGATVVDTVTATADYARLGYNIDEASELADASIIYKNVGDGITNISEASESIISTMKAFNIEASDSMTIVDKFNEIGNNFAISSKGVGDALLNSASSLATANNTLEESIALITAGNTVVQNPEKVGTALKTISMYLRAAQTEAEDAGESTDGMAKSVSELRGELLALTGGKVDIQLDKDTFKSTYEIMKDLSKVWGDLSDLTKANIIEKIGGKRNANVVTAILGNFNVAEDAVKTAADSSGSALSENAKYLDSIEGKMSKLKATFEETSSAIINSDLIKLIVEGGETILSVIGKINEKAGSLGTAATSITTIITLMKALKGQSSGFFRISDAGVESRVTFRGKTTDDVKSQYNSLRNDGKNLFSAGFGAVGAVLGLGEVDFKSVTDAVGKYNEAMASSTGVTEDFFLSVRNISPVLEQYFRSLDGGAADVEGAKESLKSAGVAIKGVGKQAAAAAIKTALFNTALNFIISAGISIVLTGIYMAYDNIAHAAEKAHENIKETNDDYQETKTKLRDAGNVVSELGQKYEDLSKGVDTSTNKNISLSTDDYKEYLSVVGQISNSFPTLIQGYDSQGNAILSCAGSVDRLTQAYKNLQIANNNTVIDEAGDFADSFQKNMSELTKDGKNDSISGFTADIIDELKSAGNLSDTIDGVLKRYNDSIVETAKIPHGIYLAGRAADDEAVLSKIKTYEGVDGLFDALDKAGISRKKDESDKDYLNRAFTENLSEIQSIVDAYNTELDTVLADIKPVAEAYTDNLLLMGKYNNLTLDSQSMIKNVVSSYGADFYKEIGSASDLYDRLRTLVSSINNLGSSGQNAITTFLEVKTKFNNGECTLDKYQSALDLAKESIAGIKDENIQKDITVSLGIGDAETVAKENSYREIVREYQQALNIGNAELIKSTKSAMDTAAKNAEMTSDAFEEAYNPFPTAESIAKKAGVSITAIEDAYKGLGEKVQAAKEKVYEDQLSASTSLYDPFAVASQLQDIDSQRQKLGSLALSPVNEYIQKVSVLQDHLSTLQNGKSLNTKDLEELHKLFPNLETDSDHLNSSIVKLLGNLNTEMIDGFSDAFGQVDSEEDVEQIQKFQDAVLELGDTVGSTEFDIDISTETDGVSKLNAAISESASATGLTSSSVSALKSRYAELDNFDAAKLFERTANGVHLNRTELEKLEETYAKQKTDSAKLSLEGLISKYNNLTQRIDLCTDAKKRMTLMDARDQIAEEAKSVAETIAQYDGLTSAYKRWQDAKSNTDDKNMYEEIITGKEEIEDLMARGWMTDDVRTYIDLLSSANLKTADVNECIAAYQALGKEIGNSGYSIWDFFTKDEDGKSTTEGIYNFFDTVESVMGSKYAWKDKDGNYNFDFGLDGQVEVAKKLGMNVEAVESLIRGAADAGFEVSFDSLYSDLEGVQTAAEKAADALSKVDGGKKYKNLNFNFKSTDIDDLNDQISTAKKIFDDLKGSDGKLNLNSDEVKNAQTVLQALLRQKSSLEEPVVMSIDVTKVDSTSVKATVENIKDYINKNNLYKINLETGVDTTESEKELRASIKKLSEDPNLKTIFTEVDVEEDSIDEIYEKLTTFFGDKDWLINNLGVGEKALSEVSSEIAETINSLPEIEIQFPDAPEWLRKLLGLNEEGGLKIDVSADTTEVDPKLDNTQQKADRLNEGANVNVGANTGVADNNLNGTQSKLNSINNGTYNADVGTTEKTNSTKNTISNILSSLWMIVSRTWNATVGSILSGIFGGSKATGTAFAQGNWGTKNGGIALGGELGQELVVRDGRFFTIGDESAEFFAYKKGDIIFNHKQTKDILSKGRIFSGQKRGRALTEGTAFTNGSGGTRVTVSGSVNKSGSSGSSESGGNGDSDDSTQKIDYIEIAIDRLERTISKLERTATSSYKTIKEKLTATASEISKVNQEISTNQKAYDKYISAANAVSLSGTLKQKVRDGSIDITEYSSETAELINEYKDLYEKALDAKDAIDELHEKIASLYENKFNDTAEDFENQLSVIEHRTNMLEIGIDSLEAKGYLASTKYYEALQDVEKNNISVLQQELDKLLTARQEALDSGEIKMYSSSWYDMTTSINEVEEAIGEANNSLLEYKNTMRSIEWDHFTYLQDEISQLTSESDFLIDLMSNSELYDKKGYITDDGRATMGLHAMNYDVYMNQADKYAEEAAKISQKLIKEENKNNTELIAHRNELLELQRESILSAENEKKAIQDLVSNGIDKELSSLKDLIDKYKESLSNAKDLYDYQKNISEQTKEISSLQKQLNAYKNDTSEETKATVQTLKVRLTEAKDNLQETEYDHFISDQEKMLDQLYNDYEIMLNERLDNIDLLLSEAITMANDNTSSINQTITTASNDVGYTMTENMQNIWDNALSGLGGTLAEYGQSFTEQLTSLNSVINSISLNVASMVAKSNEDAAKSASKQTASDKSTNTNSSKTNSNTNQKSNNSQKVITTGSRVNASGAYIYSASDGTGKQKQYFGSDPVYIVVGENNGYYKVRHHSLKSGVTGWFKKSDVRAYAKGGLADYTGYAWLDGTPQKPEMVLSPEDSANFMRLTELLGKLNRQNVSQLTSNSPSSLIATDIAKAYRKIVGTVGSSGVCNSYGDIGINIAIDHVDNYNDFMQQLTKDNQFVKFVRSFTIDQAVGGSSLAKNKYKW